MYLWPFTNLIFTDDTASTDQHHAIRAVARTLIGGGGCIFIYSCFARPISFQIDQFEFDLKRNSSGRT